VDAIC